MLRLVGRRLSSMPWESTAATSSFVSRTHPCYADDNNGGGSLSPTPTRSIIIPYSFSFTPNLIRGFSSEALTPVHDLGMISEIPATVEAVKNPTSKIVYDESNHERFPPGDPSNMSASKDVLALASLEVDLSSIEPGTTVTVKWRGKPVFIRRRTEDDIKHANSIDVASLRNPQEDSARVKNSEWLVVIGVCTHLGCIPLPNAGGWFCPCHGSHYDISGRIRKGPAPFNLEVPTYNFMDEKKLLIG